MIWDFRVSVSGVSNWDSLTCASLKVGSFHHFRPSKSFFCSRESIVEVCNFIKTTRGCLVLHWITAVGTVLRQGRLLLPRASCGLMEVEGST